MSLNPKVVPFERGADFIRQRAMKNFRDNNIIEALELMRKAVETSPDNDDYRLELAQLMCDAGCPYSSNQLLLDMLSRGVNEDECLYGLAINQLNLNSPETARRLLSMCTSATENSELRAQVEQLTSEMDMYETLNRPASRRTERLYVMTDEACERMRAEDVDSAIRIFERVIERDPSQQDVFALLGMAYMMKGRREDALECVDAAVAGFCDNVRALCVSAQVCNMSGDSIRARELLERASLCDPDPLEKRMLIFSMYEAGMYEEARKATQHALTEMPCDRQLLHCMAVISMQTGEENEAAQYWKRILRIDPEDTVAAYYYKCASDGTLKIQELSCEYQVPRREVFERYMTLARKLNADLMSVAGMWSSDEDFRDLIRWCLSAADIRFREAAVTLLASLNDEAAESLLREYLMRPDNGFDMKVRAAAMYRMRGEDASRILPPYMETEDGFVPEAENVLDAMGVGHRQLVRLAGEVLQRSYGIDAYDQLAIMWDMYRSMRGTRLDPLLKTETAAAALAYCYLKKNGREPRLEKLAVQYNCRVRQLRFFINHLHATLEKGGAVNGDSD